MGSRASGMPLGRNSQGSGTGGSPPAPDSFEGRLMALLPDLRRYSRSLARSDADGEDLLHDSLERALTSRTTWSGINLRGWVLTIMTNLYRNGARRGRRFPVAEIGEAEDLPALQSAGDPLERARLARALDA